MFIGCVAWGQPDRWSLGGAPARAPNLGAGIFALWGITVQQGWAGTGAARVPSPSGASANFANRYQWTAQRTADGSWSSNGVNTVQAHGGEPVVVEQLGAGEALLPALPRHSSGWQLQRPGLSANRRWPPWADPRPGVERAIPGVGSALMAHGRFLFAARGTRGVLFPRRILARTTFHWHNTFAVP